MVLLVSAVTTVLLALLLIPPVLNLVLGHYEAPRQVEKRLDDYIQNLYHF